jgi:hypothetical protein
MTCDHKKECACGSIIQERIYKNNSGGANGYSNNSPTLIGSYGSGGVGHRGQNQIVIAMETKPNPECTSCGLLKSTCEKMKGSVWVDHCMKTEGQKHDFSTDEQDDIQENTDSMEEKLDELLQG